MECFYMKKSQIGIVVTVLFLIFSHTARAETKYVVENMQVNARTGRSVGHKIVSILESGQMVQVLESDSDWSRVMLADGKEGWILSRFLTKSEPSKLVLERLEKKYDELNNQVIILLGENKFLKEQNGILQSELASNIEALDQKTKDYEDLKQDSSEFLELKSREQEAILKVQELTLRAENLEREVYGLRNKQNIRWFLAGSGVLFLGFLIGSISKRKRRQSLLL
jgi:SH3 domain protein